MACKYVDSFTFDPADGFTGSAKGRHDARNHPEAYGDDEYGDGSYVERMAKGGRAKGRRPASTVHPDEPHGYQMGGPAQVPPMVARPMNRGMMQPAAAPMTQQPPMRSMQQLPQAMKKGGRPKHFQEGGPADMPTGARAAPAAPGIGPQRMNAQPARMIPVADAAKAAAVAAQLGHRMGAQQAVAGLANAVRNTRDSGMMGPRQMPPAAAMAPAAQAPAQVAPQGVPAMRKGGHITAAERHALPKSDFALPGERYPIDTTNRARNALSRVAQNGSPSEQAKVRGAVHRKYPGIGQK